MNFHLSLQHITREFYPHNIPQNEPENPMKIFPRQLKPYQPDDLPAIMAIFQQAIEAIPDHLYPAQQRKLWIGREDVSGWRTRLVNSDCWVMEQDGEIIGFCSTSPLCDHVDLLYVHPDHQGQGVAGDMLAFLLDQAIRAEVETVTAKASLCSLPLFLKHGFTDEGRKITLREGEAIPYHPVHKSLL